MVTKAVAKKHREEAMREEYLRSLGRTQTYAGNPAPPLTTERVFGAPSSPMSTGVDDSMDTDNTVPPLDELSPHPPIADSGVDYLPPHYPIPENDFQPDANLYDDLDPPEPYNEGLENSALEEELSAFANIRYGWSPILNLHSIQALTTYHRGKYP